MRRLHRHRGQSTVELALALPIIAGLLGIVILAHRTIQTQTQEKVIDSHRRTLIAFNHGNSGAVVIDGVEIVPPRPVELLPGASGWGLPSLLPILPVALPAQIGLNELFSRIPFLSDGSVWAGFARGYAYSALNSWAATGFQSVDTVAAERAGYVGAILSDDATKAFQGDAYEASSMREFLGSGAQGGLVAAAASGEWTDAFGGVAGGLLASETSEKFFDSGGILGGAARGALGGALAGIQTGEFDWDAVAQGAAMGAFNTKEVARHFSWGGGNLADPRMSASFGATNAVVSVLIASGGKANLGEVAMAAAGGAIGSEQVQQMIRSDGGVGALVRGTAVNAALAGTATAVTGGDGEAIGLAVGYSVLASGTSAAVGYVGNEVSEAIRNATTSDELGKQLLDSPTAVESEVNFYATAIDPSDGGGGA